MKKILIDVLVWTPLGLYIYPKYFWNRKNSSTFKILNGGLMGIYITIIITEIIKYF